MKDWGMYVICNHCEYKFTWHDSLSEHVQLVHERVRNKCTQCEYKSGYKSNLNMHIHCVHKGLTYICNLCRYEYNQKNNLTIHTKSVHEEEWCSNSYNNIPLVKL